MAAADLELAAEDLAEIAAACMSSAGQHDAAAGGARAASGRARRSCEAAADLLLDQGTAQVSMDVVAERAGVSKATIYRWWPSKERLALDALLEWAADGPRTARHRVAAGDLLALVRPWVREIRRRPFGRVIGRARHGGAVGPRVRRGLPSPLRRAAPRADARRVRARDRARRGGRRPRHRGRARPDLRPDLPPAAAWSRAAHRALRGQRDRPRAGRDPQPPPAAGA